MFSQIKKNFFMLCLLGLLAALALSLLYNPTAPDLTYTTLSGKKISMASLKGKAVLISFWATDCPSCNKEMPELVRVYNAYKAKGFEIIAVAMPYDPPAQLQNYVSQKSLPFPVMHDGFGEVTQAFGDVNVTPTAFLFDKLGRRINKTVGILDFTKLRSTLDKELG